jgi:hypothetical protein
MRFWCVDVGDADLLAANPGCVAIHQGGKPG